MATFRELTLFGSFWLCTTILFSQSPSGNIFGIKKQGPNAGLFVIDYPAETILAHDSSAYQDLCLSDSFLYINSNFVGATINFLYQYRLTDLQKSDSLALSSYRLASWQDKLVVLCDSAPYLRVLNPIQGWSNLLQLDTNKLPDPPLEVIIDADKAYLLYSQSFTVISLSQGDTLGSFDTPHPYPGAGYNTSISQDENNLYIGVDYATGAIRTSLLRIAKSDNSVHTAFHKEFRGFYSAPVPYLDRVFVYTYSDHYNLSQDSLFEFPHVLTETVLAADSPSQQIFVWDVLNQRLSVEYQSQRSNGIGLSQQPDKLIWRAETQSVATEPSLNFDFKVYPNPSADVLQISFPAEFGMLHLALFDLSGRLLAERSVHNQQMLEWSIGPNYPRYFMLKVSAEDGRSASRLIQKRGD